MAREAKIDGKSVRATDIRTFELVQYVTGWPKSFPETGEGAMDDLPANLQDQVFKAMERKSLETGLALAVVLVRMGEDLDLPEDDARRVFLHVVLSEVLMMDTSAVRH